MRVLVATICIPDDRAALSAVRALASAGAEVYVGGQRSFGQAFHSRSVRGVARYPHPAGGYLRFADTLMREVERLGIEVLVPTADWIVEGLSRHREETGASVSCALPPREGLAVARNKLRTLQAAQKLGISIPKTLCPAEPQELADLARQLHYPVVVKPRKSMGAIGLWFADSSRELVEGYGKGKYPSDDVFDFNRPLIQEYIPGQIHEVCGLFREGEPLAVLTQRRILMYPASGGAGILNETTWNPDLKEQAVALLRSLDWHGPAQVEFKLDERSGRDYRLMEINGRFWGTLDLSVQAGINFPWLACLVAAGRNVRPAESYRVGLRYRWPLPFGLLHAMQSGDKWEALRTFFLPTPGMLSDLRLSDPLPHVAEMMFTLRRMCRRRSLQLVRASGGQSVEATAREIGGHW